MSSNHDGEYVSSRSGGLVDFTGMQSRNGSAAPESSENTNDANSTQRIIGGRVVMIGGKRYRVGATRYKAVSLDTEGDVPVNTWTRTQYTALTEHGLPVGWIHVTRAFKGT